MTRKSICAVAAIQHVQQEKLYLGNPDARRGWEHAKHYALATGETHTVPSFVERAFAQVQIQIAWRGHGVTETGVDAATERVVVEIDPRYFRPNQVDLLVGDPSKARRKLGWSSEIGLDEPVAEMVDEDMARMAVVGRKTLEM